MCYKPTRGEGCGESVVVVVGVGPEGDDHGVPGGLEPVGRELVPAVSTETRLCPRGIHNVLHLKDQWKIYIQMLRVQPTYLHAPDQNFFVDKKVFQSNANCPLAKSPGYVVNKSEHARGWVGPQVTCY